MQHIKKAGLCPDDLYHTVFRNIFYYLASELVEINELTISLTEDIKHTFKWLLSSRKKRIIEFPLVYEDMFRCISVVQKHQKLREELIKFISELIIMEKFDFGKQGLQILILFGNLFESDMFISNISQKLRLYIFEFGEVDFSKEACHISQDIPLYVVSSFLNSLDTFITSNSFKFQSADCIIYLLALYFLILNDKLLLEDPKVSYWAVRGFNSVVKISATYCHSFYQRIIDWIAVNVDFFVPIKNEFIFKEYVEFSSHFCFSPYQLNLANLLNFLLESAKRYLKKIPMVELELFSIPYYFQGGNDLRWKLIDVLSTLCYAATKDFNFNDIVGVFELDVFILIFQIWRNPVAFEACKYRFMKYLNSKMSPNVPILCLIYFCSKYIDFSKEIWNAVLMSSLFEDTRLYGLVALHSLLNILEFSPEKSNYKSDLLMTLKTILIKVQPTFLFFFAKFTLKSLDMFEWDSKESDEICSVLINSFHSGTSLKSDLDPSLVFFKSFLPNSTTSLLKIPTEYQTNSEILTENGLLHKRKCLGYYKFTKYFELFLTCYINKLNLFGETDSSLLLNFFVSNLFNRPRILFKFENRCDDFILAFNSLFFAFSENEFEATKLVWTNILNNQGGIEFAEDYIGMAISKIEVSVNHEDSMHSLLFGNLLELSRILQDIGELILATDLKTFLTDRLKTISFEMKLEIFQILLERPHLPSLDWNSIIIDLISKGNSIPECFPFERLDSNHVKLVFDYTKVHHSDVSVACKLLSLFPANHDHFKTVLEVAPELAIKHCVKTLSESLLDIFVNDSNDWFVELRTYLISAYFVCTLEKCSSAHKYFTKKSSIFKTKIKDFTKFASLLQNSMAQYFSIDLSFMLNFRISMILDAWISESFPFNLFPFEYFNCNTLESFCLKYKVEIAKRSFLRPTKVIPFIKKSRLICMEFLFSERLHLDKSTVAFLMESKKKLIKYSLLYNHDRIISFCTLPKLPTIAKICRLFDSDTANLLESVDVTYIFNCLVSQFERCPFSFSRACLMPGLILLSEKLKWTNLLHRKLLALLFNSLCKSVEIEFAFARFLEEKYCLIRDGCDQDFTRKSSKTWNDSICAVVEQKMLSGTSLDFMEGAKTIARLNSFGSSGQFDIYSKHYLKKSCTSFSASSFLYPIIRDNCPELGFSNWIYDDLELSLSILPFILQNFKTDELKNHISSIVYNFQQDENFKFKSALAKSISQMVTNSAISLKIDKACLQWFIDNELFINALYLIEYIYPTKSLIIQHDSLSLFENAVISIPDSDLFYSVQSSEVKFLKKHYLLEKKWDKLKRIDNNSTAYYEPMKDSVIKLMKWELFSDNTTSFALDSILAEDSLKRAVSQEALKGYSLFSQILNEYKTAEKIDLSSLKSVSLKYRLDGLDGLQKIINNDNELIQEEFVAQFLQCSKLYRKMGQNEMALEIINKLKLSKVQLKLKALIALEESKIYWADSEPETSIYILNSFSRVDQNNPNILYKLGKMVHKLNTERPLEIMDNYFQTSISWISDERLKGKAHMALARMCHEQYLQLSLQFSQLPKNDLNMLKKLIPINPEAMKQEDRVAINMMAQIEIEYSESQLIHSNLDIFLESAVNSFLHGLKFTDKYDCEIFKVLSLWFRNFSNIKIAKLFESIKIPCSKFLLAKYQLVARWSNRDSHVEYQQSVLSAIIESLLIESPFSIIYELQSQCYSEEKKRKLNQEVSNVVRSFMDKMISKPNLASVISQVQKLCDGYFELGILSGEEMKLKGKNLKLFKLTDLENINPLTCESAISVGIAGFKYPPKVLSGINEPKLLDCIGTDGLVYCQIVKGKDEMRQDAIMEQVFLQMNQFLSRSEVTKTRKIKLRTYKIIPFHPVAGVMEFVKNSIPIGDYLIPAHETIFPKDLSPKECRKIMKKEFERSQSNLASKFHVFTQIILPSFQPVFRNFFFDNFQSPSIWFARRESYVKSMAVNCIAGYIIGLGDRHTQNILLDKETAEVVQIDLNMIFEQGKVLRIPEKVPFRLTRDLIDGMGVLGVDGTFKKSCELVLNVFKANSEFLMALLEIFRYDPLYKWNMSPIKAKIIQEKLSKYQGEEIKWVNDAERSLSVVRRKLKGEENGSVMSTSGHVNYLIQQACDPVLLCAMYPGWQPWL